MMENLREAEMHKSDPKVANSCSWGCFLREFIEFLIQFCAKEAFSFFVLCLL